MTSIPRDTLTEILGETSSQSYYMFKVNSAYQFGGSSGSVKTVSAMLNVPINYYVEVNMKALKSLVNALGGVDVNVPFSFSYDWCDFHKGKQHLDGRHAIAYARMRYDDPRGDYGRQLRQRQRRLCGRAERADGKRRLFLRLYSACGRRPRER